MFYLYSFRSLALFVGVGRTVNFWLSLVVLFSALLLLLDPWIFVSVADFWLTLFIFPEFWVNLTLFHIKRATFLQFMMHAICHKWQLLKLDLPGKCLLIYRCRSRMHEYTDCPVFSTSAVCDKTKHSTSRDDLTKISILNIQDDLGIADFKILFMSKFRNTFNFDVAFIPILHHRSHFTLKFKSFTVWSLYFIFSLKYNGLIYKKCRYTTLIECTVFK